MDAGDRRQSFLCHLTAFPRQTDASEKSYGRKPDQASADPGSGVACLHAHRPDFRHTSAAIVCIQWTNWGRRPGRPLAGVELILHGGDITVPAVLDWCEQFAPVLAVRGNNDIFDDPRLAEHQFLDVEGFRIGLAHELRPESRPIGEILAASLAGEWVDVLIGGDTHVERLEVSRRRAAD